MDRKRAHVSFNDEQIDIEDLVGVKPQPKVTEQQKQSIAKNAEETGFLSREVIQKKPKLRSPYVIQKNIKMRIGMAELLAELATKIGAGSDQEALERAVLALIEKEKLNDLQNQYNRLINFKQYS